MNARVNVSKDNGTFFITLKLLTCLDSMNIAKKTPVNYYGIEGC